MWEDVVVNGKHSLQTHVPKVVKQWCPVEEHDYAWVNVGSRLVRCRKCGMEVTIIVGKTFLKDGKIVEV